MDFISSTLSYFEEAKLEVVRMQSSCTYAHTRKPSLVSLSPLTRSFFSVVRIFRLLSRWELWELAEPLREPLREELFREPVCNILLAKTKSGACIVPGLEFLEPRELFELSDSNVS